MRRWSWLGISLFLLIAPPAHAGAVTIEGLTFSDERGGFRLLEVSGEGSTENPFIVVEEVTDTGPAILTIYGLSEGFGNRIHTQHLTGFAMIKIAINRSGRTWLQYQLELREVDQYASPYSDGLSFGQASSERDFVSSAFPDAGVTDEPYDALSFANGSVPVGEKASFRFIVTDASPSAQILLVQEAYDPLSAAGCAVAGRCMAEATERLWR
jgi:hypothetical protein